MENKPKFKIDDTGTQFWFIDEIDGEDIFSVSGRKYIWLKYTLHRLDGPALIYPDNLDYNNQWWINGNRVDNKIIQWATEFGIDLYNLTEVDKALIKLTWANYGK